MISRTPLTTERIVSAAVRVADERGLAGVSMRTVGRALGVEAMSLYHHLSGKDALLDALSEWIYQSITAPKPHQPWRDALETRARSARDLLARHPWALGMVDARRTPGPGLLSHHDAVLGCLRSHGFSIALALHTYSALDAFVFGFAVSERNLALDGDADVLLESLAPVMPPGRYPALDEVTRHHIKGRDYDYGDEFEFGLTLVLDGIERHRSAEQAPSD